MAKWRPRVIVTGATRGKIPMANRSQETISEIRRKQKRLQTAKKTFEQVEALLAKSTKILMDGPSYQRSPIPADKIARNTRVRMALKKAKKELIKEVNATLDEDAMLLRQRGVRPYRKRQKTIAIH